MRKFFSILIIACIVATLFPLHIQAAETKLFPADVIGSDGAKFGYIDENGVFVIKPVYDFAYHFNDKGIALVANGESTYATCTIWFINKKGKAVSGPFKSVLPEVKDGYSVLNTDNGNVIVDSNGKIILKTSYTLYEYGDGLVVYSQESGKKNLYGYMSLSGKIIVPAKYTYATAFKNGQGKVTLADGNYNIIDKNGKIINNSASYSSGYFSDGYASFYDKASNKYGYKKLDGSIAISARYTEANDFEDGYAVVKVKTGQYEEKFALIDKKGNYIYKPVYSGITPLGYRLFAVSNSEVIFSEIHDYSPKAIMNVKGQRLTDYLYYNIDRFQGDYAVASNNTTTFFIDQRGNIVKSLPRLDGLGSMSLIGDIIKAELDGSLTYLRKNGDIIWQKDNSLPIGDGLKVKIMKYRRDYCTFIEYPEIQGLDTNLSDSVNTRLKIIFTEGFKRTSSDIEADDYTVEVEDSFNVKRNKELLIIERTGYDYPLGAAHGMPKSDYFFVDIKKGSFYELKDLFKVGTKFTEKLASIIHRQLELNSKVSEGFSAFNTDPEVPDNQPFFLTNDSLVIYYYPYAIAPYAAGFPRFEIPYGQLSDIIDTNGAFWNSFDKKIINHKIQNFYGLDDKTINSISSRMATYEKQMIEAINSNSFSKVEGCLLNGSSLYNSQKKLVQNLFSKKIKEKLVSYEVYAIDYDSSNMTYKVYVLEEIGIQYPGKNFENKKYSWCYTVIFDSKAKSYKLSGIQKW